MPTTAIKYAGTVSNDNSYGSSAWTNPTRAQGNPPATPTLFASNARTAVQPTNFKYDTVKLIVNGNVVGANKSDGSTPGTSGAWAWKDFNFDLTSSGWNTTMTDQQARQSNLGFVGAFVSASPTSVTTNYLNGQNFGFGVTDIPSFATINTVLCGFYASIPGSSFAPGTLVSIPFAPYYKAIEQLKIGDKVLGYWRGQVVVVTVMNISVGPGWVIEMVDDVGHSILSTGNHRFYTDGYWRKIRSFKEGQTLHRLWGGKLVPVKLGGMNLKPQATMVYNLQVSKSHNYFANGFLVHNGLPPTTVEVDVAGMRMQIVYNEPAKWSPKVYQAVNRASTY